MFLEVRTPFSEFLKYDPADCAALVAGFALGPKAGLTVVVLRNILRALLVKPDLIGLGMNTIAGVVFVASSAYFYGSRLSRKAAMQGLFLGGFAQILVCLPTAYVALSLYGFPLESRAGFVWAAILPFNVLKVTLNGFLTFWLYKSIATRLPRYRGGIFQSPKKNET